MLFHIQTFGCKSNQYESQGIRELLEASGHCLTGSVEEAEAFILNSCGVTGRAAASCRNALRKAHRLNPHLVTTIVTGCGVDLREKWPELENRNIHFIPNEKKHTLAALLSSTQEHGAYPHNGDRFGLSISSFHGHTRAFIKIQDGCDNHCTYCAVPMARGVPESRNPDAILAEAERLIQSGHQELVTTGINIGAYSWHGLSLADIVLRMAELPGLKRLRLGSVEPPQLLEPLVEAMRSSEKICPHIHLPLQSGDPDILRLMGRRYTHKQFLEKVRLLNERLDRPAITTDIIVGFPGENEHTVSNTLELCRLAGFSRLHVFLYSPRPGTPSASMAARTPQRIIEQWKSCLIREGTLLSQQYAVKCVGMAERVIFEKTRPMCEGLTDRYLRVIVDGEHAHSGGSAAIRITRAIGEELHAIAENV